MSPASGEAGRGGASILLSLARTELISGLAGLKLFMAAIGLGSAMLALVWFLAAGVGDALDRNGRQILGGDAELQVGMTPLDTALLSQLSELGRLSTVVDMRSTVRRDDVGAPIELRAVDAAYPLYGAVGVSTDEIQSLLASRDGVHGAVVESTLLDRLDAAVGDSVRLGDIEVEIRGVLTAEPDRLGVGALMVGPRVLVSDAALADAGLLAPGALVEYRYRLAAASGAALDLGAIRSLEPATGWRLQTPDGVAERVKRAVDRTTTFMGIAGVAAMAVAISGAWAAAAAWVRKRGRTIALYRLSGADRATVALLHGLILMAAAVIAILAGVLLALVPASAVMGLLALTLPVDSSVGLLAEVGLAAGAVMLLGVAGAGIPAIAAAAGIAPGAAMRSGEPPLGRAGAFALLGGLLVLAAMALSVLRLPDPSIGARATLGLIAGAAVLALFGRLAAGLAGRIRPRGFVGMAAMRALSDPQAAAAKAVAIGIGIAAITAVDSISIALERGLQQNVPDRLPELVLIDVQPDQRTRLDAVLDGLPGLDSASLQPNLRANIRTVNGLPARDQVVDRSERWVLEGDRGLTWTAERLPGPLLAGAWWPADYAGPMLLSISDDVAEAFAIGPGDTVGFAVLGRELTGEVANVRDLRWQAVGANFIMVASPDPLRSAPHNWIATIEGDDAAVDRILALVSDEFPNVTAIDVRTLLRQLADLVGGAATAALAVALALLLAGGIALAAVIAADADARAREGLAFALVGASRRRIALARLGEVAVVGVIAAVVGGAAGLAGGLWLADAALRVDGVIAMRSLLLPLVLGVGATLAAGLAAGVIAMPRRPGGLIRQLAG